MGSVGAEDLDDPRCFLQLPVRTVPYRPGVGAAQGSDLFDGPPRRRGRDGTRLRTTDGDEGFAEVFFDDVFIPDPEIGPDGVETEAGMARGNPGDVDQGWGVAMATTSSERGLTLRSPGRFQATATRLLELARERVSAHSGRGLSDTLADAVTDAWIDAEAYSLYTLKDVSGIVEGRSPGARSSYNKIFWSELDVRLHQAALDILGPDAELPARG